MSWLRRLINTVRPARLQRDIDRELAFHITERADDMRAGGLSDQEARRRARIQFGNPLAQRERTRDADIAGIIDASLRNVRLAVRGMRRTPGFTLAVVLTLALGIGANSAVFSAIDAVLLRPLPFPDGDRLVQLTQTREGAGDTRIAPVRLQDWNRLNTTFDGIAGYFTSDVVDTRAALPERLLNTRVTPGFFEVLGVPPALGRNFTEVEHQVPATKDLRPWSSATVAGAACPPISRCSIDPSGSAIRRSRRSASCRRRSNFRPET